jgi:hypothetical protein
MTYEIFVNGRPVAQRGTFPPGPEPLQSPSGAVFDLPAGVVSPGSTAVVAWRVWSQVYNVYRNRVQSAQFEIDESRNLHLANDADRIHSLLSMGPDLALNGLVAVMGIGLLVFWRWTGGRELLLYSGVLLLYSISNIYADLDAVGILVVPWRLNSIIHYTMQEPTMAITVEFIWAVHGLRARGLKYLTHAAAISLNVTAVYMGQISAPTAAAPALLLVMLVSVQAFNLITIAANLWAFFTRRQNRLIAAALMVIPIASLCGHFGISIIRVISNVTVDFFNLGFIVSSIALFIMLGQRAWGSWRSRDELRVEFDAAREVQQKLVAPAVDVPGFKIDSVYSPAKQVGGDFFRVAPETDGSILIVVGDVSGKGLPAAMTVSAIIGALRAMPSMPLPRILRRLNRGLVGQLGGGFVTCCAARIGPDGAVAIANAGHLSPYRAGAEVAVPAGLPLGIAEGADYDETHFQLQPGETLTFLSDGVIEARNPSGELFGFERTLAISTSSAEAIAQAAIAFGQDDDITVLTLTRLAHDDIPAGTRSGQILATA